MQVVIPGMSFIICIRSYLVGYSIFCKPRSSCTKWGIASKVVYVIKLNGCGI